MSARKPARRPASSLRCERLEDRATPAIFGNPWPDAGHLTLSFAPDGTDVSGVPSSLSQALGATLPAATWQGEIARAFQTWSQFTNVDVAVVADDGSPVGTPGPVQGSPRFGDIRVSARPLSDNVLAVTNPFDLYSTWAGDIVLNSNKVFSVGSASGGYDLYTVLLQESGHALGVANSPDSASVMYETYGSPRTGLSAGDVTAVRALYGARTPDAFDADKSNGKVADASEITFVSSATQLLGTDGTSGDKPLVAAGDLTTQADIDYYKVNVPKNAGNFSVALNTNGLSQLAARVSVLGPDGKALAVALPNGTTAASAVAVAAPGQPFVVTVPGGSKGGTFSIKVEAATAGAYAVGAYRLSAGYAAAAAVAPPATTGFVNNDFHTDDTRDKARDLTGAVAGGDGRWHLTGVGSIANNWQTDADWYKVKTAKDSPGTAVVLVSARDASQLAPSLQVYDKGGAPVAAEVLSSVGGTVSLQLRNVKPDTDYYFRVAAADPLVRNSGNYFVGLSFRSTPVALGTLAAGTLQGGTARVYTTFALSRSQSLWFDLSGQAGVNAAVRLTVYDANDVPVFTLRARGGEAAGANALLAPGNYTVKIAAAGADGAPLPAFAFQARYNLGSDPIGVQPLNPSAPPVTAPPPVWVEDPLTQTYLPFLGASTAFAPPAGGGGAGVITWGPYVPTPTFTVASLGDLYNDPWW